MSFGRTGYYVPPKDKFPELNPYRTTVAPRRRTRPSSVDSLVQRERGFEVRKGKGINTSIPGYESMADPHLLGHFRQSELRTFMMETGVLGRDMSILLSASAPHRTYQPTETVLTSRPRSHVWSSPIKSQASSHHSPSGQASTNRGTSRSNTSSFSVSQYRAEVTTPNKWTTYLSSPDYSPYESEIASPQSRGNHSPTERGTDQNKPTAEEEAQDTYDPSPAREENYDVTEGQESATHNDKHDSLESSIHLTSLTEPKSESKLEIDDYDKGDPEDQKAAEAKDKESHAKLNDEETVHRSEAPKHQKPKSKKKEKLTEARELAKKYATYDDSESESESGLETSQDEGLISSTTESSLQVSHSNDQKEDNAKGPISQQNLPKSRFSSDSVSGSVKPQNDDDDDGDEDEDIDSEDEVESLPPTTQGAQKHVTHTESNHADRKSEETSDTYQKLFQSSTATEHSHTASQNAGSSEIPEEVNDRSSEQSKKGPKQLLNMDDIDALLED